MADEAIVRKACEAYDIRQDGLLDLYHMPGIMYIVGLYPTESMYNSIGRAEAENQYYINIRHAITKIMELIRSQEDAKTKTEHPLPSTSPLSSPELDNPKMNRKNLSAIPPLPQSSPLSSPEFNQDEFRDMMLKKTYQANSNKVLGINWSFERNTSKLPPFITQTSTIKRKESRDPRIRSRLRRQEQEKEKSATIQID